MEGVVVDRVVTFRAAGRNGDALNLQAERAARLIAVRDDIVSCW